MYPWLQLCPNSSIDIQYHLLDNSFGLISLFMKKKKTGKEKNLTLDWIHNEKKNDRVKCIGWRSTTVWFTFLRYGEIDRLKMGFPISKSLSLDSINIV